MTVSYEAAYYTLQEDPGRREIWLLEVAAYNTVTEAETTLYFSSAQYGTGPYDTPAHRKYKACITRGFEFDGAVEMLNGPIYGLLPARSAGSIVLGQTLGDLDLGNAPMLVDVPIRDYAFAGRTVVVKHGGYSPALGRMLTYAEFATVFTGEVDGQPQVSLSEVTFKLRSRDSRFQYPINTSTYYGCKGAILFPVGGGKVVSGTAPLLDVTSGDFSWEFLYYCDDATPASDLTLVSRGSITTDGVTIRHLSSGVIQVQTHQSGVSQTTTSSVITAPSWDRFSIVRVGASIRVKRNNIDITATPGTHINPTSNAARVLYFGRNNADTTVLVNAMISDIRFWSIALTDDAISSRMHRPLDSSEYALTGLVAYWPCDDGTGTTLAQKVVATGTVDYNGTLSAGAVFVPSLMGGDEMQGDLVPQAWGYFDGFSPILVDEGTRIYQIHAGSMDDITRVDIGGTAATVLDVEYTSVTAMLAVPSTTSGKHDTCITAGGSYVRFGSSPSHPVTVAGRGDNTGGTFRGTVSALVRFIVCNTGWYPLTDPTDLDTTSFTTLASDSAAEVGYVYSSEHSIADVLNYLLQTIGAVGYFARNTDLFTVKQFKGIASAGTPTRTITEHDIDIEEIEVLETNTPVFRTSLNYRRNYKVLSPTDFTIGLAGSDREKYVRHQWRTASQVDRTTKVTYPDATVLEYDTAFNKWVDAIAEGARQLTIFKTPAQGFRFKVKQGKLDFDRMEVIYFDIGDLDANGVRQNRLGSGPTRKINVLDVSDDVETSGAIITVWRDDA